jgi:hypothetical protein
MAWKTHPIFGMQGRCLQSVWAGSAPCFSEWMQYHLPQSTFCSSTTFRASVHAKRPYRAKERCCTVGIVSARHMVLGHSHSVAHDERSSGKDRKGTGASKGESLDKSKSKNCLLANSAPLARFLKPGRTASM